MPDPLNPDDAVDITDVDTDPEIEPSRVTLESETAAALAASTTALAAGVAADLEESHQAEEQDSSTAVPDEAADDPST